MSTLILMATLFLVGLISFYNLYRSSRKYVVLWTDYEKANENISLQQMEIESLNKRLSTITTDSVTQLPSWQIFMDRLKQKLKDSARVPQLLAIMVIDLHFFHLFTERYGASSAEWLLTEAAKRIERCLRQVDTVTRLSNQRFVVLLGKINNKEGAAIVAERILNILAEPINIKDEEVVLNAQIGIAIHPDDGMDSITLLSKAEQALKSSQEKGGQAFQFYTELQPAIQSLTKNITAGWLQEIKLNELNISFRPIYDVEQHVFLIMQTRVSWMHPHIGEIDEGTLFRIADQQSRSMVVSEYLLKKTCAQYQAMQNNDSAPGCFSIPITIRQFKNYHFMVHLLQILRNTNIDPLKLVLEVITDVNIHIDEVIKSIELLRSFQVKLAIRDFGLQPFPIHQIKNWGVNYIMLAPVFSHDINHNSQAQAVLKSLINLANGLSVLPIVDKTDSEEKDALMRSLGCRYFVTQQEVKILSDS